MVVATCVGPPVVVAHGRAALMGVDVYLVGGNAVRCRVLDCRLLLNFGHVRGSEKSILLLLQARLVFVEIYVVLLVVVHVWGWACTLHADCTASARVQHIWQTGLTDRVTGVVSSL